MNFHQMPLAELRAEHRKLKRPKHSRAKLRPSERMRLIALAAWIKRREKEQRP